MTTETRESKPEATLHSKTFSHDMREISGFGGSYELGCRLMVLAGVHWLETNPDRDPHVGHYRNITGIDKNLNEDAEALEKAMLDAPITLDGREYRVGEDATGAMVQYSKMHALRAKHIGWDAYCAEMRKEIPE